MLKNVKNIDHTVYKNGTQTFCITLSIPDVKHTYLLLMKQHLFCKKSIGVLQLKVQLFKSIILFLNIKELKNLCYLQNRFLERRVDKSDLCYLQNRFLERRVDKSDLCYLQNRFYE